MKVTKFIHSCLLVETPDRTAIFDPGSFSGEALTRLLDSGGPDRLDDIFITHVHADHCDPALIKKVVDKFPDVRITGTSEVVAELAKTGIKAGDQLVEGVGFFQAPHEAIFTPGIPQNIGIHYLDKLSDPGDSHSFSGSMAILALPVQAPWGSAVNAFNLAVKLKPQHVLPIHDWHWNDQARAWMYSMFEKGLGEQGITFHKLETGKPVEIDV